MTAKDALLGTLDFSETITKAYISDLTAADLLIRPVPGMNHIAWQVGHLILSEHDMLDKIRPGSSPTLPADFQAGHGFENKQLDDPALYRAPADYLALMAAQRATTRSVLAALTEPELDGPSPEGFRQMAPTVGGVFGLMGQHVLMHVGQWVAVRRQLDKPIAF